MIAAVPKPKAMSTAPIPSSQRPIPLQGRNDLITQKMEFEGAPWWVLKDPVALRYHRLQALQYRTLCLLDGERSLKGIRDQLMKEFPATPLPLADVQRMITSLHGQGLVWNQRPGQSAQMINKQSTSRRQQLQQTLSNVLTIRLPGWDPDPLLRWMHRGLGWVFHPATGLAAALLVISSWILLLVHFDDFRSRLPEFQQFFSWHNLAWLWLTMGLTKVIHEFGHALTCRHYGGECHEMGVMLLIFSPTLYCDVTDSWMLRDKWKRIWIAAGGMIIELVLSACAILVWWNTTPGLLNHLCLNVFFVSTTSTVLFNANPLMRYDGYYMLSDWLGVPNLRATANSQLRDTFAEYCFGIIPPLDPQVSGTRRFWLNCYAIASAAYGWLVLSGVTLFLYFVLKPYGLQSIGMTIAIVVLSSAIGSVVWNVWRILAAPRSEPMSRTRIVTTIALGSALIAAALAIPLPWYIQAPFLLEPHAAAQVLVTVPGELASFAVRPGEHVEQGQVLATLVNHQKEDQLRKLRTARETQLAEISMLYALELSADHALALKHLDSIERQIQELQEQLSQLTIIAPISGRVVAAPATPTPPMSLRRRLSGWFGHIDNPANLGAMLETRTPLLSIAPDSRMQAVLYLDQAHRDDLVAGREIQIKFETLADRKYRARVMEIASEHSVVAPPTLTTRLGGSLASVTDAQGHERLTSVAYQARVILEQDTTLLKPGMRGQALFLVDHRSAAHWLWREFRRTMHFRL